MTTKMIDRVYGTQEKALLAALRGLSTTCLYPFTERGEGVYLVRTMCMLILTIASEALTKKHQSAGEYASDAVFDLWRMLEKSDEVAELHVTSELSETDSGTLARKFVTQDRQHTAWIEKSTLDIWADSARALADFQFYSVEYHGATVEQSAIRVERTKGCVCGYIMPMRGLREQVY